MKLDHPANPTSRRAGPKRTRGCNTRFENSFCSLGRSGVDSVSYALRPRTERDDAELARFIRRREFIHQGTGEIFRQARGPAGSSMVSGSVDGMRLGVFPGVDMIFAEGRLAAMLARSEDDHDLAPASKLTDGAECVGNALAALGFDFDTRPESVRRLDLAAELCFEKPADGLSFLRAMATLEVPGTKRAIWVDNQRVETVYFRTPKRGIVNARIYGKNEETGLGPPGGLVRLERQVRYPKAKQQRPESISGSDLEALYRGRFTALSQGREAVIATGLDGAQSAVLDRVADGALTARKAERILGTLTLLEHFGQDWWEKGYTARRRVRELQELGIVLDLERKEREPVPVGELLRLLIGSFAAS